MNYQLISLCLLFFLASCNGQDNAQSQASGESIQETQSNHDGLSQQDACEALSLDRISQLMDVDESLIKQEDMSFGKKRSICYYYTEEGNRKFFIRMAWASEKAAENKVLQKQYENYLANGENEIKEYLDVSTSESNQILYGIGQDSENKYIHLIRKRFDNQAEIQLEVTKEDKDESMKEELLEVLNELD